MTNQTRLNKMCGNARTVALGDRTYAIITLLNDIRTRLVGDYILSKPVLAIGGTTTAVAHGIFLFSINGQTYYKAADATGVAPGNDIVPEDKYGAVAFEIGVNGTVDAVEATANSTGYASAALAVAGLPAVATDHARMGYVTAMKSDGAFTFGTTDLNAANTTVAYTDLGTAFSLIGDAVTVLS